MTAHAIALPRGWVPKQGRGPRNGVEGVNELSTVSRRGTVGSSGPLPHTFHMDDHAQDSVRKLAGAAVHKRVNSRGCPQVDYGGNRGEGPELLVGQANVTMGNFPHYENPVSH